MSGRFITYVIIGVAFGCTQLWFVYWVVRLFKEKQRVIAARRAGERTLSPSPSRPSGRDRRTSRGRRGSAATSP